MSGWSKEAKVKILIKAFLTLNNRKCNSKEISQWINMNNFGMNNTFVHPNMITKLVKTAKTLNDTTLRDVNIEKEGNVYVMWV
ncbi:MAG: hypothetical protein J6T31_05605 [Methanobrevibacter sp.]|nr:hypothetical protein [Methanobrevibacter sp.]